MLLGDSVREMERGVGGGGGGGELTPVDPLAQLAHIFLYTPADSNSLQWC